MSKYNKRTPWPKLYKSLAMAQDRPTKKHPWSGSWPSVMSNEDDARRRVWSKKTITGSSHRHHGAGIISQITFYWDITVVCPIRPKFGNNFAQTDSSLLRYEWSGRKIGMNMRAKLSECFSEQWWDFLIIKFASNPNSIQFLILFYQCCNYFWY